MNLKIGSLDDLMDNIKKYSPMVATAIGGPYGALIGTLLSNIFGVDPKTGNADDLSQKIASDPDASLKLVQFQYQHETALQKILAENYKTETQDRQNARQSNNTSQYPWVIHVLSSVIILGFMACLFGIVIIPSDPGDHDILNMMFGILSTAFGQIIVYYYSGMKGLFNVKQA